jgi:putative ABC transport system substrate-binding protein
MNRREFITLLGGAAAAWPLAARAQQSGGMRRIGVLIGVGDDAQGQARLAAFRQGMQDLGWSEGRNIRFDIRFSEGDTGRARAYAAELLALAPNAILANTAQVVSAFQQQTRTIPIVFVQVLDPVSSGFVESLARPGGNITGFSGFDFGLGAKWLELLKDVAPNVTKVGVLRDPTIPSGSGTLGAIQVVASSLKVELVAVDVREEGSIERGLAAFASVPNCGLIVAANPGATMHVDLIVALAARYRLPAVYPYRFFATSGGLISYGSDNLAEWRRAASYVDRVLKGENPADLPVQQPTKYELVINLKTARALGFDLPAMLLARADEVIE